MASIKISNTAVETNLANIEGLVGYRTNPTTQGLETVQIAGNYVGGTDPTAPKQGFVSTKPFTIYEIEADIQEFPGNSNRSILSYSGIETYGNLEVFTQTGIASFIGQNDTVLKSNEGDVTIEGGAIDASNAGKVLIKSNGVRNVEVEAGARFDVTSDGGMTIKAKGGTTAFSNINQLSSSVAAILINTVGSANNAGHIEIQSAGSATNNKGIVLKSATNVQVDLHTSGSDAAPVIGQALLAKDTDGNVRFGDAVKLAQTAQAVSNSGLRYSSIGNNGLQVNGITARGIKVTTSQTSGVQVDFSGVTSATNKALIGAPMLGVIQAADAPAARSVLGIESGVTSKGIIVGAATNPGESRNTAANPRQVHWSYPVVSTSNYGPCMPVTTDMTVTDIAIKWTLTNTPTIDVGNDVNWFLAKLTSSTGQSDTVEGTVNYTQLQALTTLNCTPADSETIIYKTWTGSQAFTAGEILLIYFSRPGSNWTTSGGNSGDFIVSMGVEFT
jgi:hypothetical protein